MKLESIKLPIFIIVIGLVAAVLSCLLTGIVKEPTVTEPDLDFSVTYKLDGEIKTVDGVYSCRFNGDCGPDDPIGRSYVGEYTVDGVTTPSRTFTIAQKDGLELYIVVLFNDYYLMNDTSNESYEPSLEAPTLEAIDKEGMQYDDEETLSVFDVEIVSWDYPEPVENSFVFKGFSILHVGSMLAMLAVGILVILACVVFVKKDSAVSYNTIDRLSVLMNFFVVFALIPFITFIIGMLQITMDCDSFIYQVFLCIPAFTAFTIGASVALRRKGFAKTGFFIQLVAPAFFILYAFLESVISGF